MVPALHVACVCCRLEAEVAGLPGTAAVASVSADQRTAQATAMDPGTGNMHVGEGRKRARDADDDGYARSSDSSDVSAGTAPKRERRR
jgi:hypothetical protein